MKNSIWLLLLMLPGVVQVSAQSGNVGVGTNTPTSKLHINGSVAYGYRAVGTSTTLDGNDYIVEYNGTTAATLTLPDATTCKGRSYHIKNISTTIPTPVVTILPQSGQTEDSKTSWILDNKNELANIISDGANWHVYAQMVPTAKTDSTGGPWLEGGNADPNASLKKFGTISNNDLPIITNASERMRVTKSGNIGIGTSTPTAKLEIASGTANSSGLKFTNMTSSSPTTVSALLGVDASGTVVVSATAAVGPTGPAGVAGINGTNGTNGAAGPTGAAGANGTNGATGPAGAAGTNGTNGAAGPTGAAGATGPTGLLTAGTATGNTPYWNGSAWVVSSSNIHNTGTLVGINNSSPVSRLDVYDGVTTNNTTVNASGSINDFLQYNIQNTSTGTHAQSGYSATADNGTNTTGFAWMGINNSTFNFPSAYNIGGANDVSYIGSGQDMYIANANNTKSMIFSTGTATTPYFAERMRITGTGNVGIGTSTPGARLEINSGVTNTSGLKFTNMTSTTPVTASAAILGIDAAGNVVTTASSVPTFTGATATVAGTAGIVPAPAAGNQNKFLTGSGGWATSFPLITANGTSTATTETRDFNAWVTKGTGFYITDVGAAVSNPIPNESAWFEFSQVAVNGGYFGQTSLNDHNFYYRGGASTGLASSVWQRMMSVPATSQTQFVVDATNNVTLNNIDNRYLAFATNSSERMKIDSLGKVRIGPISTTFDASNPEAFLINCGNTTSDNAIVATGTYNHWLQFNINNKSNGTQASSDVVATANNGSDTTNFIDMGINSSGYVAGASNPIETGKANDGYLMSYGNDFYLVNASPSKDVLFLTGGSAAADERMRITASGNVGIANSTPAAKLDVAGTFRLGAGSPTLNNILKTSISITDLTTFSYTSTQQVTATVTGANTNGSVILNPRSALPTGIAVAWVRVSSANTITIGFINSDATARDIGTVTFDVTVIQ